MGLWDWLLGDGDESANAPSAPKQMTVSSNGRTYYTNDELMALNDSGGLYPNSYDFMDRPKASTAYHKNTFQKLMDEFSYDHGQSGGRSWDAYYGNSKKDQKKTGEYKKFLAKNRQSMSPEDLLSRIGSEVAANKSAIAGLALRDGENMVLTGGNKRRLDANTEVRGETGMANPFQWATEDKNPGQAMPTVLHEQIHSSLAELARNGELPPHLAAYILDWANDGQHSIIDVMGKRLYNIDNPNYSSGTADEEAYDELEKIISQKLYKEGRKGGPR